jgi:hypothetical protein
MKTNNTLFNHQLEGRRHISILNYSHRVDAGSPAGLDKHPPPSPPLSLCSTSLTPVD